MLDKFNLKDKATVRKIGATELMDYTDIMKIDGHEIPIYHKQNKPNPELIFQRQSKLNQLALWFANRYLSPAQKSLLQIFHYETSRVRVEKFKDKHVAGFEQDSVAELTRKGYTLDQIYHKLGIVPYLIVESHSRPNAPLNVMLNEGIDVIWDLVDKTVSAATDYFDLGGANVGVGTSATAAAATDTELLAGAVYVGMDGSFPTSTTQKINFKGTFGTATANIAWEEFSVRNENGTPKNLCRIVTPKGTKVSGETWTLEIEITGS